MVPDKRKRAKQSDLSKFMTIDAFLLTGAAFRRNILAEVHSVNPSNQAGSDTIGTALSPTDGSLCSEPRAVAVDDEVVSGPIANSHPQLAKRKDKLQPANQK